LIVNGGSASAAEIIAGALQDHKRALVVGQKTYGKGSVQLIYTLTDGSSLHVTNAQWFTPNNHQISGQGLLPDVIVAEGQDPLQVAIEQSLGISEN
jgi:carboxyl-terminal processing protease